MFLGIGGNNTQEVLSCFKTFDFDNVDAIFRLLLIITAHHQKGLLQHFKMVSTRFTFARDTLQCSCTHRNEYACGNNTRTEHNEYENIIGVKEASGNFDQIMTHIIKDSPDNFLVISGDDNITYPLMTLGADGVISVAANAFPAILQIWFVIV